MVFFELYRQILKNIQRFYLYIPGTSIRYMQATNESVATLIDWENLDTRKGKKNKNRFLKIKLFHRNFR